MIDIKRPLETSNYLLSKNKYLIISFALGFLIAFLWFSQEKSRQEVCKNEIDQLTLLNEQLTQTRKTHLTEKNTILESCQKAEREICVTKVERYKTACMQLKCEICERRGQ